MFQFPVYDETRAGAGVTSRIKGGIGVVFVIHFSQIYVLLRLNALV